MATVLGIKIILFSVLFLQAALYAGGKKGAMISKQKAMTRMKKKLLPESQICALCQDYLSEKINLLEGKISSDGFNTLLQQVNNWHRKGHRSVDPVTCSPQRNEGELIEFEKRELRRSGNNI